MSLPTPIAYWNFDNNLNNQASSSYHFTNGGATYIDNRITDNSSKSIYTNGSNTYAYTSSSPFTNWGTQMTVAQWTKNTEGLMFGCNTYSSNSSNDMVKIYPDGFSIPGFGAVSGNGLPSAWNNGWVFTCIVFKGVWNRTNGDAMVNIYKYKTKASSCTSGIVSYIPHQPNCNNNITIGRWYHDWVSSTPLYGSVTMDSAYIFSGQLTDTQVYALYDFTAPKFALQSYA